MRKNKIVYEIISQPDQPPAYQNLMSIFCNDEELVGIMVRNSNLLKVLIKFHNLKVEDMIAIITAGEEDGRKYNPYTSNAGIQTEWDYSIKNELSHATNSLLMKDEELEEIHEKVNEAEVEIERLKRELANTETKAKVDIEKYK